MDRVLYIFPDPWHFGADPDPDPRIYASYQWIQIHARIWICYFRHSLKDLQDANKKIIFCSEVFEGTFT